MFNVRRWRRRATLRLVQTLLWFTHLASFKRIKPLGMTLGSLQFHLDRRQRRQCADDLAKLLQRQPDDPRVAATLRSAYRVSNAAALEILALHHRPLDDSELLGMVKVDNLERLRAQLAAGKPVVLLCTHMGNGFLLQLWLARSGLPVSVVYRESRKMPKGMFDRIFSRYGVEGIAADRGARAYRDMLRALRNGRILCIIMDQGTKRPGGVPVTFLGKAMAMPAGPAQLVRQAGAVILPVQTLGAEPVWAFALGEPVELETDRPMEESVRVLTRIMEQQILKRPELWSWHQRRWRNLPFAAAVTDVQTD